MKVELRPLDLIIEVGRGSALRPALAAYGLEFPCGGRGMCSGCRVKVLEGGSQALRSEYEMLSGSQIAEGWRLACRLRADRDMVLEVGQWETLILGDFRAFDFVAGSGHAIAVDLGTTTIVAQLLDLATGRVLGVRSGLNPHTVHGGDIMSRIQAVLDEGSTMPMAIELRESLGQLIKRLLASVPPACRDVEKVVIAGNSVMHHIFCGLDLLPLARAPFETKHGGPREFSARELSWPLPDHVRVMFLGCLGSFIGSDILCGIIATGMHVREEVSILVDLGTNGEIVVGNRDRILCASTAAGPAFEGGGISMGMRATNGAIDSVEIEGGQFRCSVIGDAAARGICGSGLVDAVAAALEQDWLLPGGRLATGERELPLSGGVSITQSDIRALQLAKAAIAAGIKILKRRYGVKPGTATSLYLAGAFGNYVNTDSARRIGLVPEPDVVESVGNTSLLGAKMALFAQGGGEQESAAILDKVEHVALGGDAEFQDLYVREMTFPE